MTDIYRDQKERDMKQWNLSLLIVVVLMGLLGAAASQTAGARNYDPNSEMRVKGIIQEVQQTMRSKCRSGTHLIVKVDADTVDIHVGPSSYIEKEQFSFAKGDEIEVLGSAVTIAGEKTLIAREITRDGKTLILRNAQGIPQWSGGKR